MKKFVVIGNSAAGIAAAQEIRKLDPIAEIIIVSDEKGPAYSRCLLSYYLSGQIDRKTITFRDKAFYAQHNIKLLDGKKIININKKEKKIILDNKEEISYYKLLIATGSAAKTLPFCKDSNADIFLIRTIADAEKIIARLEGINAVAILGAGLIGIKVAQALHKKGKKVFVIARSNNILSQMLDANSAEFLSGIVADKINLLTGIDVKKIDCDNNQVNGVLLSNNEKIECQLVIITKGVTPNTQLAKDAGLTVNWGIVVDNTMKTSAEDIYAAGDAAETLDLLTGERDIKALWTTAIDQGTVAGKNMAAEHTLYDGAVSMNSIDCFGIPCIAAGNLRRDFSDVYDFRSTDPLILRRIFVNRNRIHGFVAAGDLRFAGILNNLLKEKRDISTIKDKLGSATLTRADLLECLDEKETVSLMKKGN